MLVLIGASASGKSSVEKCLVKLYDYKKLVTYTTRPMRDGEVDGVDYHFIDCETFKYMADKDLFAEIACYNNWYYSSLKEDYTDNKVAVLTPSGLREAKKNNDLNIVSFYINVPRRDRLIKILQRGDSIDESYRRNLSDVGMFDGIQNEVDYVITNPNYTLSIEQVASTINRLYLNN